MMQRALTDVSNNVSLLNRESKIKKLSRPLAAPDIKPIYRSIKSVNDD